MARDYSKNKYIPKGFTVEQCKFENRKALTDAFSDPRYGKDQDYTELCAVMANNGFQEDEGKATPTQGPVSGRELSRAMSDPAAARKQEFALVARERYQAMFTKRDENGNLLYDKSPSYREEVRQFLVDNSAAIDAQMPEGALIDRNLPQHRQAFRIEIGKSTSSYDDIKQGIRDKQAAQDAADLAEKHAALDRGESPDKFDLGGRKV